MNCNCVATINEKLKPLNLQLACEALIMPGMKTTLTLQTEWIDKSKAPKGEKGRPSKINITYCPFCGKLAE